MRIAIPKGSGEFYTFSNEDLKVGDKVFPLVDGWSHNGRWHMTGLSFKGKDVFSTLACTGWRKNESKREPHTIREFYFEDGLRHVRTDKGYGNAEVYFKLLGIDGMDKMKKDGECMVSEYQMKFGDERLMAYARKLNISKDDAIRVLADVQAVRDFWEWVNADDYLNIKVAKIEKKGPWDSWRPVSVQSTYGGARSAGELGQCEKVPECSECTFDSKCKVRHIREADAHPLGGCSFYKKRKKCGKCDDRGWYSIVYSMAYCICPIGRKLQEEETGVK